MDIAHAAEKMLTENIIPFWSGLCDGRGGFYGWMGQDLKIEKDAVKGCILNSRILWFFSEAAMYFRRDDLKELADHAYEFLTGRCADREYGGLYWSLTAKGAPLDRTKHTYNQAFGLYALSSYYMLTGDERVRERARELFELIETLCRDDIGYLEAFTQDWRPAANDKLSENGVLASRTMNTLLHVFEGYSGYYQATRDFKASTAMRRILSLYAGKIYDGEKRRQRVFMDDSYRELIDLTSFGHDIESSWLMDWGCGLLEDRELSEAIGAIDSDLAQKVLEQAYIGHSVVNEREKGVTDTTRVWWVQAESVLGFLNQWAKHPEQTGFRDAALDVFDYIRRVIVDPRPGGEWFWSADRDGKPIPEKPIVEAWKCPYHNGRMCLEIIRRYRDAAI